MTSCVVPSWTKSSESYVFIYYYLFIQLYLYTDKTSGLKVITKIALITLLRY